MCEYWRERFKCGCKGKFLPYLNKNCGAQDSIDYYWQYHGIENRYGDPNMPKVVADLHETHRRNSYRMWQEVDKECSSCQEKAIEEEENKKKNTESRSLEKK
jgi:hypothetical protein